MAWSLSSTKGRIEHMRQLAIWGESRADWLNGTIEYRPGEGHWVLLSARRSGKRAIRGQQPAVHCLDEVIQYEPCKVCDVALRGITSPKPEHSSIASVRWACLKPTDPEVRVLYENGYGFLYQGVRPGFGELLQIWAEKR